MLNQVLYDCLEKLFGEVVVINEGQQADLRIDRNHLGRWDIDQHSDHGEQYAVNCPFCKPADTNHHLYTYIFVDSSTILGLDESGKVAKLYTTESAVSTFVSQLIAYHRFVVLRPALTIQK